MLPDDLILVLYRLVINVVVWRFINMVRLFPCQNMSSEFILAFEVSDKRGKWERWLPKEEICLDFIQWHSGINILWTRNFLITKINVEGKSLEVNCSPSFGGSWISIATRMSRTAHKQNVLRRPENDHIKRPCYSVTVSLLGTGTPAMHTIYACATYEDYIITNY
jgi:hypothetical protein